MMKPTARTTTAMTNIKTAMSIWCRGIMYSHERDDVKYDGAHTHADVNA
jgi:hypothetical protein